VGLNILCLGGAGFIGRHVIPRLLVQGHSVTVVDSLDRRVHPQPPVLPDAVRLLVMPADRTPESVLAQTQVVIHLAAQVSVADSASDPNRYVAQNSLGTSQLLDRLPDTIQRVVVASSMSVYGEGGYLVQETAPVCAASVYGLTKYDQERLCLLWGAKTGINAVALRFFNVYGPEQALTNPYTGVLANFAQKLLKGEPPIIYEDGLQSRDFIFVDDVADAVVRAATGDPLPSAVYNVCTGYATTVRQAAEQLARALKVKIEPVVTGVPRVGDIRHCTGDPSKLNAFGWRAKVAFADGIQRYAEWLRTR
jgi:dTDP-L-rhamnose 4-epimerase